MDYYIDGAIYTYLVHEVKCHPYVNHRGLIFDFFLSDRAAFAATGIFYPAWVLLQKDKITIRIGRDFCPIGLNYERVILDNQKVIHERCLSGLSYEDFKKEMEDLNNSFVTHFMEILNNYTPHVSMSGKRPGSDNQDFAKPREEL